MRLSKKQQLRSSSDSWTIKSLVNLSKLTVIVVFIKYELFNQQQVFTRSRGLIYNRDGKFIYKPPKSNQGHIIVIDDRHRESSNINYHRDENLVPATAAYPSYSMINQRLYRPETVNLASLAVPVAGPAAVARTFHNQGEQMQLISLNELQNFAQGLALNRLQYQAAPAGLARATSIQSPSLPQNALQSPSVLPVIQILQPTRKLNDLHGLHNFAELVRARTAQDYEMQLDHNHNHNHNHLHHQSAPVDSAFGPRISLNQSPTDRNYETDSPISSMEMLQLGLPEANLLDDLPAHQRLRSSTGKHRYVQNLGEFDPQLMAANSNQNDDLNRNYLEDFDEQLPSKQHELSPQLQHQAISTSPSRMSSHLEPGKLVENYRLHEIKAKPSHEKSAKFLKRTPSIKPLKISDSMRKPLELVNSQLDPNETSDLKAQKGGRYWKQFKDQFDIIQ